MHAYGSTAARCCCGPRSMATTYAPVVQQRETKGKLVKKPRPLGRRRLTRGRRMGSRRLRMSVAWLDAPPRHSSACYADLGRKSWRRRVCVLRTGERSEKARPRATVTVVCCRVRTTTDTVREKSPSPCLPVFSFFREHEICGNDHLKLTDGDHLNNSWKVKLSLLVFFATTIMLVFCPSWCQVNSLSFVFISHSLYWDVGYWSELFEPTYFLGDFLFQNPDFVIQSARHNV